MIVTQEDVLEVLRKIRKGTVFEILYELYKAEFTSVSSEYVSISRKLVFLYRKGLISIDKTQKIFVYSIIE